MGYSLGGVYDSDSKERRIESHVLDGCPYLTAQMVDVCGLPRPGQIAVDFIRPIPRVDYQCPLGCIPGGSTIKPKVT